MAAGGVVCPYPVFVPHSNRYAVAALCGLTVPRSVAATAETPVAAAAPAPGATSAVVNTWSAPAVVPARQLAAGGGAGQRAGEEAEVVARVRGEPAQSLRDGVRRVIASDRRVRGGGGVAVRGRLTPFEAVGRRAVHRIDGARERRAAPADSAGARSRGVWQDGIGRERLVVAVRHLAAGGPDDA